MPLAGEGELLESRLVRVDDPYLRGERNGTECVENRMREPSGDHSGAVARRPGRVSLPMVDPSAFIR